VESVAWITERRDLLSAGFLILAVIAYMRAHHPPPGPANARYLWICFGCFLLSLLSKAWGITLPAVLLILDVFPLRRIGPRNMTAATVKRVLAEKIPFVLAALAAAVPALLAQSVSGAMPSPHYGPAQRTIQAAYGLWFYLWKTVLPVRLSPLYLLDPGISLSRLKFAVPAFLVVVITIWLLLMRRRRPWALTAWLCYAVVVSPVLGFAQSGPQAVADRYSYLSCLPFAVLAALGVMKLWAARRNRLRLRTLWGVAVVSVLLALSAMTVRQIGVWRNTGTLWDHVASLDPSNYVAHNNRGVWLRQNGDLNGALAAYGRAIRLNPSYARAYAGRAALLAQQGNPAGAVKDYEAYLRLRPESADIYFHTAALRRRSGDLRGALQDYSTLIRMNPKHAEAYSNRGSLHVELGQLPAALSDYEKALEVAPPSWPHRPRTERLLRHVKGRMKRAGD
jgi:Tfp pilus assembly protein PilF